MQAARRRPEAEEGPWYRSRPSSSSSPFLLLLLFFFFTVV
jgi:hypothetical protein